MRLKRMSLGVKILGFIFISGFVLIGGYTLITGISGTARSLESNNWPTVSGKVILSRVVESKGAGESALTSYYADIAFTYAVNGKEITSGMVSMSDLISTDKSYHEKLVAKYPQDARVTVFYNPNNPRDGVLEPGFTGDLFIPLIVGGVVFLLGVGMLVGWILFVRKGDRGGELTLKDMEKM